MEREADAYAVTWLQGACIPPARLADLLERLTSTSDRSGLLDTHPGTAERLAQFRSARSCTRAPAQ